MNYLHWRANQSGIVPTAIAVAGALSVASPNYRYDPSLRASSTSVNSAKGEQRPDFLMNDKSAGAVFVDLTNERIKRLRQRTSKPNWNGAGAPKLGAGTFARTKRLLGLIADHGLPVPRITADDGGYLVLDWRVDSERTTQHSRW